MPTCQDCGEQMYFRHPVEGEQVREYDAETGEFRDVTEDRLETTGAPVCDTCDSANVVFDDEEATDAE
jgi:hypothetical protein